MPARRPRDPSCPSPALFVVAAVLALSLTLAARPAAAKDDSAAAPKLEVLARYEVPATYQKVTGIQWAGKDSVYLGDFTQGVVEVELRKGLPRLEQLLGTLQIQRDAGLPGIVRFHVSDDWVVALHTRFAWARRSSGHGPYLPTIERMPSGAFDFDVDGTSLVMWGGPDIPRWKKDRSGMLWRADLTKGLERWEVLYKVDKVAAHPGLLDEGWVARGSVKILDDGDILLAPNTPRVLPPVLLFSSSGKLKQTWTANQLWSDGEGQVPGGGDAELWRDRDVSETRFFQHLARARTVDAVLELPQGPAIVVREPRHGATRWRLALLSPEVRWFDIPTGTLSSVAQLRGDADKEGRIVLVGTTRELYEKAQLANNQLLVVRLPAE